jgi:hypothetical protein
MRMLLLAVSVGAFALGNYVSAQDKPVVVGKPRYTAEAMRQRIGAAPVATCRADKTEHPISTTVAFAGKTYRCVTVLNENFAPVGAAWTAADPQP